MFNYKMINSELDFLAYLNEQNLFYERIEHPAVFTCAEAGAHHNGVDAVSTKNLFLCDKKARHFFLVVTACEKNVNLEDLSHRLHVSHLRFASEENLMRLLGVSRGSVTIMGLVNDQEHQIQLWVDQEIWGREHFLAHPLVNTATLLLSKKEMERFLQITGHNPSFF